MATIDTVNQLDGTEPCACGGGCDWRGPASALLSADDAILTPGDPSPAGRCPECESLAYVVESTEGIDAFAVLAAIQEALSGKVWDSDTPDEVAAILRGAGYEVAESDADTPDFDSPDGLRAEPSAEPAAKPKQYMACPECGCTDVEITAWVKANTGENTNSEGPAEYAYCPQCEVENLRDRDLDFVAVLKPYKAD